MTSNPTIKPSMRNPTPVDPTSNSHRASVPISVYRELAAELQTAEAMLDSLNAQNQQLVQQNYQLRQEIEKVVQSALHMQQVMVSLHSVNRREVPYVQPVTRPDIYQEVRPEPTPIQRPQPVAAVPTPVEVLPPPPPPKIEPPAPAIPEKLHTEQQEVRNRRHAPPEKASDVSGWLLVLAIIVIVMTAFGTGFLIVRPLLNNNNSR